MDSQQNDDEIKWVCLNMQVGYYVLGFRVDCTNGGEEGDRNNGLFKLVEEVFLQFSLYERNCGWLVWEFSKSLQRQWGVLEVFEWYCWGNLCKYGIWKLRNWEYRCCKWGWRN